MLLPKVQVSIPSRGRGEGWRHPKHGDAAARGPKGRFHVPWKRNRTGPAGGEGSQVDSPPAPKSRQHFRLVTRICCSLGCLEVATLQTRSGGSAHFDRRPCNRFSPRAKPLFTRWRQVAPARLERKDFNAYQPLGPYGPYGPYR